MQSFSKIHLLFSRIFSYAKTGLLVTHNTDTICYLNRYREILTRRLS